MSEHKYLLMEFMDQFGELKHLYQISALKQNALVRQFIDRIQQMNDGFILNDDVVELLRTMIPNGLRISAKKRLNARSTIVCKKLFADQMDILTHCVSNGWNSGGYYPYWKFEAVISASECLVNAFEDIDLNQLNGRPENLAECFESMINQEMDELANGIRVLNAEFEPLCPGYDFGYVKSVLFMQKRLFCDALKSAWHQTYMLNELGTDGSKQHKPNVDVDSLLASESRTKNLANRKRRFGKRVEAKCDHASESHQEEREAPEHSNTVDHLSFPLCAVENVKKVLSDNKKLKTTEKKALEKLCEQKGCVSLEPIPPAYRNILVRFKNRFPHIHALADEIEANLSLLSMGGPRIPLHLLPQICILDGVPGVGKTVAMAFLAKEFDLAFRVIDCSGMSNGFDIIGQSSGWATGKAGYVANMLINKTANPIIILDEVDKMGGSETSPVADALYSLLEQESAKRFRDEYYDFEMDASRITWLATSNDYKNIPAPIRDRAKRIIIPLPDIDQRKIIACFLYQDVRLEKEAIWGKYFEPDLPGNVVNMIAGEQHISIRGMKQIIQHCFSMKSMQTMQPSQTGEGVFPPLQSLTITEEIAAQSMHQYLKGNGPSAIASEQGNDYQQTRAGFIQSVPEKELS